MKKKLKTIFELSHICALPLTSPCYICQYGIEDIHEGLYPWDDDLSCDYYCSYHPKSKNEWIKNLYNSLCLVILDFICRKIRFLSFCFRKLRKVFKLWKKYWKKFLALLFALFCVGFLLLLLWMWLSLFIMNLY